MIQYISKQIFVSNLKIRAKASERLKVLADLQDAICQLLPSSVYQIENLIYENFPKGIIQPRLARQAWPKLRWTRCWSSAPLQCCWWAFLKIWLSKYSKIGPKSDLILPKIWPISDHTLFCAFKMGQQYEILTKKQTLENYQYKIFTKK